MNAGERRSRQKKRRGGRSDTPGRLLLIICVTAPCAIRNFLVPKLCLGTHSAKLCFASESTVYPTLWTGNRVSRSAYPNRVWAREVALAAKRSVIRVHLWLILMRRVTSANSNTDDVPAMISPTSQSTTPSGVVLKIDPNHGTLTISICTSATVPAMTRKMGLANKPAKPLTAGTSDRQLI